MLVEGWCLDIYRFFDNGNLALEPGTFRKAQALFDRRNQGQNFISAYHPWIQALVEKQTAIVPVQEASSFKNSSVLWVKKHPLCLMCAGHTLMPKSMLRPWKTCQIPEGGVPFRRGKFQPLPLITQFHGMRGKRLVVKKKEKEKTNGIRSSTQVSKKKSAFCAEMVTFESFSRPKSSSSQSLTNAGEQPDFFFFFFSFSCGEEKICLKWWFCPRYDPLWGQH